jgi:uncharacterized RmlC-like cupin family protein
VPTDWRTSGVRVVRGDELDINTPQTPGMTSAAAITTARTGAEKLWAGTVIIEPDAKTGPHHHGPVESVIYVVSGRARMRWGERLEYVAEAGPGDFIYIPPYVPRQEINAEPSEPLSCVLARRSRAGGRESRPRRRRAQPAAGALGRRHPLGAVMFLEHGAARVPPDALHCAPKNAFALSGLRAMVRSICAPSSIRALGI